MRLDGETVAQVFKVFDQVLLSYVDALTLDEYRREVEVIRLTSSTQLENSTSLDTGV